MLCLKLGVFLLNTKNYTIQDYLKSPIPCNCGRIHSTQLKHVVIDRDILCSIPYYINNNGYKKVFLVSDSNTYLIACKDIENYLAQAGIPFVSQVLPGNPVIPDENTLGHFLATFDPSCDLIIGVGAGTINDICKFCSYQLQRNYFIVATAPSMDGFASNGAALITKPSALCMGRR
jgi:glycerol-1-phosphate dehydrogenase [NAD(P)+]